MTPSLVIRPLEPADRGEWERLWRAYLDFYETRLPDDVIADCWRRLSDPRIDDMAGLIAIDAGHPVGIAHYLFHSHFWKPQKVTYLQDLYVQADCRGKGAGRALIEAVYAAADAAGCPSVYWLTAQDNEPGRRLYDRIATLTPFIKYQR